MKKKPSDQLVIELDGRTVVFDGRKVEAVDDIGTIRGSKWVVTDFRDSVPRFMKIDAPVKFAETLLQRRLQESGETTDQARIVTHSKRALNKQSTELFFTAVDAELADSYNLRSISDADHQLVFASNSVLLACLRQFAGTRLTLVILEHDRHADYLIGRQRQLLAAGRVSTYDATARHSLGGAMTEELRRLGSGASPIRVEQVVHLNWLVGQAAVDLTSTQAARRGLSDTQNLTGNLTGGPDQKNTGWATGTKQDALLTSHEMEQVSSEWVAQIAKELQADYQALPPRRFDLGEEFIFTSLPDAITTYLQDGDSCSPPLSRFQYLSQRLVPAAVFITWGLVILLLWGNLLVQQQIDEVEAEQTRLRSTTVNVTNPEFVATERVSTIQFIKQLAQLWDMPSVNQILAELSQAKQDELFLDRVLFEFSDQGQPTLTLVGRQLARFEQASQQYHSFLSVLQSRNFRLLENSSSADINELRFTAKLVWEKP
ncbi:MAG: hypothetical protein HQL58_03240 [Magnetococcales bacterium]|nr:hypothetical protein [Magnetococcales bacterium]